MRLPDFIIIGAAKAGTTSLHAMLSRHPGIFMSTPKEPEFFARDSLYFEGLANYARLFEKAAQNQLAGEASTLYSLSPFFPETASRIAHHLPKAKLVYVLRNPVDRAFSFYIQLIKSYRNKTKDYAIHRTFEDCIIPSRHATAARREKLFAAQNAHLPDDPELCLAGSDYVRQIEAYLAHFPREQMLFLKFEDFREDAERVLRTLTDFLEVGPLPAEVFSRETARAVSADHFRAVRRETALATMRRRLGPAWALRHMIPAGLRKKLPMDRLMTSRATFEPPAMAPETRCLLQARFAPDVPRLEELTGLDLSDWALETR